MVVKCIEHIDKLRKEAEIKMNISTTVTDRRFVWANGRAAGIGRTIPVRSIGRLPLLRSSVVSSTRYLEEPAELPKQNGGSS